MSNNRTTGVRARRALSKLEPYSPGKPIWEVQRELGLTEVIKLASNENALGPSPRAIEAVAAALPEMHRYPDAQAHDLKGALAAKLQVDPGQIIVTNGGDELITLLSESYLEPGDEVVVPDPSFSEYIFGAHLMDAVIVKVPMEERFRYYWRAIAEAVTERTKLVYLCSPNNPTGTYMRRAELQQLLDALPPHVLVIMDSAYSHFVDADDYSDGLEFIQAGYPVLMLQTFSKIYGLAGIRVGYGVAQAELINNIQQVKEPFNVNALAQTAALAALEDDEHVQRSRDLVVQERLRLYAAFDRLGVRYTESMSNFILLELGPDAERLYKRLMEGGVIVRYGRGWGLPHCIRVSVGTPAENDKFLSVLELVL
ncbi:histidinol-phosphate transaminase [Paenibacillus sp. HJGM_3]|uniref:histidinol-phosphate transaminase n=1 Tax=Paenibacillus sp. HJGM_3 TaxID=3379816 RepID=UPI00385A5024